MGAIPTVYSAHRLPQPAQDLLDTEAVVFVFSKQTRENQSVFLLMEGQKSVFSIANVYFLKEPMVLEIKKNG